MGWSIHARNAPCPHTDVRHHCQEWLPACMFMSTCTVYQREGVLHASALLPVCLLLMHAVLHKLVSIHNVLGVFSLCGPFGAVQHELWQQKWQQSSRRRCVISSGPFALCLAEAEQSTHWPLLALESTDWTVKAMSLQWHKGRSLTDS